MFSKYALRVAKDPSDSGDIVFIVFFVFIAIIFSVLDYYLLLTPYGISFCLQLRMRTWDIEPGYTEHYRLSPSAWRFTKRHLSLQRPCCLSSCREMPEWFPRWLHLDLIYALGSWWDCFLVGGVGFSVPWVFYLALVIA